MFQICNEKSQICKRISKSQLVTLKLRFSGYQIKLKILLAILTETCNICLNHDDVR